MNPPDNSPDSEPQDEEELGQPPSAATVKSRAIGCFVILLGIAAAGGVYMYDGISRKLFAALMACAAIAPLWGLGMILFPWTEEMFAMNSQDNFGKMYAVMPRIWKLWFFLCIGAMIAAMFAALIMW